MLWTTNKEINGVRCYRWYRIEQAEATVNWLERLLFGFRRYSNENEHVVSTDRWMHTEKSEDINENFLFIAASEWVSVANAFDKQINIVWCASFVTHFESYNLACNIPFETFRLHFVACLVFESGIFVTFPIPFNKLIGCCLHLPLQYGHRWLVGQSICSAQYVAQNLCPSKLTYSMYEIRPKLLVLVQRSHILGQKLYRSYFEATF